MTGTLVITHGLPGSGKSTWAEQKVQENPSNIIRVNRDDIRTALFGNDYHKKNKLDQKDEQQVTNIERELITRGLKDNKTVISDNTNLNAHFMSDLISLARENNAIIKQEYFDVPVETAKERNRIRGENGGRLVPDFVIDRMAAKSYSSNGKMKEFIISNTDNKVFAVDRETRGSKILDEYNKKLSETMPFNGSNVVLVDVDGTLAHNARFADEAFGDPNKKRNYPLFYKNIVNSEVNPEVLHIANSLRENDNVNVVILTARGDEYATELLEFISRSGIKASRVIARRKGDGRKDFDFKEQILRELEKEGFIIVHAMEDRDGAASMYERNNITVTRVDEHVPGIATPGKLYPMPKVNTIYGTGVCIRCGSVLKNGGNIGPTCVTKI